MPTIAGKGGMVYLQGSGAAATKLGEAREWRIDMDAEYEETTEFADAASAVPWRTQELAAIQWGGRVEGNFDTAETSPFDAVTARAIRKFYLYPVAASTARYYYGTIWPRLSVEAGLKGPARYELEFDGDGTLATN